MKSFYQPAEDSYLLEEQVKKFAKGKSFLDMGAGSGIQSISAKLSNAKSVLAVDINPESVAHLKSIGILAIKSNLFSNIKGKFDLIAFNPPYLPRDKQEPKDSQLATTGGRRGDEIILKFLKQSVKHLNPHGIILLVLSSLTPTNNIIPLLHKLNLSHHVLSSQKLFMEELFVLRIAYSKTPFSSKIGKCNS